MEKLSQPQEIYQCYKIVDISVEYNKLWNQGIPTVSVITPVYNRINELLRCINSVKNQTFHDFEYIIVNDGSTHNLDSIVKPFLDTADFAVLYIKKPNGGVHTARNAGIRHARGKLIAMLDSDDEFLPDALKIFIEAWNNIPDKENYAEIKAMCIDQNGVRITPDLPDGINSLPMEQRWKIIKKQFPGEQIGFRVAEILKANTWPEPEGITFVNEDIVWQRLHKQYKTLFINNVVRIYHTETDISYTKQNGTNKIQLVKNKAYNACYMLNEPDTYIPCAMDYLKMMMYYCILDRILKKWRNADMPIKLSGRKNRFFYTLFYIPAMMFANTYIKKKL